jgi:tetratricopeptide (TPR) repeat protein
MATTTTDIYRVISLDDSFEQGSRTPDGERAYARLRRDLDIGAFGAYAIRAAAGKELVHERTATHPAADRHEELYVVLSGHARVTVDGEEIDAPAGTTVFVSDVEAKRSAVAVDGETTLLLVGGRRGEPWRLTPGEATEEFWPLYEAKDYEAALAIEERALEQYPGNALANYNIACMSSLLGRPDEALEHLAAALDAYPEYVENAREDDDFAPVRDDPRFRALVESRSG